MRAPRSDFARRSARYSALDALWGSHTRFFGAAAVVNAALAQLFNVFPPIRASDSFRFLDEAGAALEAENLNFARDIPRSVPAGLLDRDLVFAEQTRLQRCVLVRQAQDPRRWGRTREALNALLNERYPSSLISRCNVADNPLPRVLREVRAQLGSDLDFEVPAHRIRIGLQLIEHLRGDACAVIVGLDLRRLGALPDRGK